MATALVLLLATYVGIVAGIAWLVTYRPHYKLYWLVVGIGVAIVVVLRRRGALGSLLGEVEARKATRDEHPKLLSAVSRLAGLTNLPVPAVYVAESDAPNAFSVGIRQKRSSVVVTHGLLKRLDTGEVEAVLAHELAHLAHRDAAVMTAVAAPRSLGEAIIAGASDTWFGLLWLAFWPLGLLPFGIGTGLTLTVSRYREFAADRGSALITGAPEQLMSALEKVSAHAAEIPHADLRAANAFCIVSTETQRFTFFSDHPPLEQRLAALAEIAREMGKPVS